MRGESDNYIQTHNEECIGVYDEVKEENSEYSTISECVKKEKRDDLRTSKKMTYSLVNKVEPPLVPKKSPELYRDLKVDDSQSVGANEEIYTGVDDRLQNVSKGGWNPAYESSEN